MSFNPMKPVNGIKAGGLVYMDAREISAVEESRSGVGTTAITKTLLLGGTFKEMYEGEGEMPWYKVVYPGYTSNNGRSSMDRAAIEFCMVYGVPLDD